MKKMLTIMMLLTMISVMFAQSLLLENFEGTYPPANWTRFSGLLTDPVTLTSTTSGWTQGNFAHGDATNKSARVNLYGTSCKYWLVTPSIDLGTGTNNYNLEFTVAFTKYSSTAPIDPDLSGVDDKFVVLISTDNGTTWSTTNVLRQWDNAGSQYVLNSIPVGGTNVSLPLSAYSGTVKFAFYGESTVSNSDNYLWLDKIKVRVTPTTPMFYVTPTSKDFGNALLNVESPAQSFTFMNAGINTLNIASVALAGADASQFILTDTNTYPMALTEDQGGTFSVKFMPTSYGTKTAVVNITDDLGRTVNTVQLTGNGFDPTITAPTHTENFDAVTVPLLPVGWTKKVVSTSTSAAVETATGGNSAPNHVKLANSGDANATVLFISPMVQNLNARRMFFNAKGGATAYNLTIGTMTDPLDETTFTAIETISPTATYTNYLISFAGTTGSYIAFKHGLGGTYKTLYVDDIMIENIPQTADISVSPATVNFGGVPFNGTKQSVLTVLNQGAADLIYTLELPANVTASVPGATVIPGGTSEVTLTFTATAAGEYTGTLNVLSNDPDEASVAVPVTAFVLPEGMIEVGSGSDVNTNLPMEPYYKNSYTQSIFYPAEIPNLENHRISKLYYHYNGFETFTDSLAIYMAHTDSVAFAATTNWIPGANLTQVYYGTISVTNTDGWVELILDQPFTYNGTQNLVIAVKKWSPEYHGSNSEFFATATTGVNRSMSYISDSVMPDPMAPPTGTLKAFIPNTRMFFIEPAANPIFGVTPTEKNFGQVIVNSTTNPQTFTISNLGSGNLGITSVVLTGTHADQFMLTDTNTYPAAVAAGASITFNVAFHPTSVGQKGATIEITDNLTRTVHYVALSGEGFDPTITIPHTQNFDVNVTIPNLPTGWVTYASATGTDARPWVTQSTAGNAVSAPNHVGVFYHTTNPKNEWMVTPPVALTAGTTYRVKFMVKAPGWSGTPEKMKMTVANAQTLEAVTAGTVIWDDPNMLIAAYTEKTVAYTPATTGNYYFAWHAYSDADVDYIRMDDITFEVGPVLNPPTALTATAGNANVSLSWTAPAAGSTGTLAGYNVYRDDTAITTAPVTGTTYTDNTVTNGTTYSYYVTALYTTPDGESDPSNTVSATPVAPVLYPPTNLTGSVTGNDVTLNWSAAGPEGDWITHADDVYNDAIGTGGAVEFAVANRFTAEQLATLGVAGGQITRVRFMAHEPTATYTVKVWTGGSGNPYAPGTEAASQAVPSINVDNWTEVNLTTPVTIPANGELWIGYSLNTPSGYPAGTDAGPALNGFGNMMYFNNAWTTLTSLAATLDYNWIIQGYATEGTGRAAKYIHVSAPAREKAVMDLTPVDDKEIFKAVAVSQVAQNRNVNRNLLGYKVYRGTTLLTPTPLPTTTLTYQDMDLANGEYTYNVTAMYTDGESAPATVTVVVNPDVVINQFPWNEGFEGTFPPMGWMNVDNDGDTYKWVEYTEDGAAHAGAKCVASASYINNVGALTPDNWFITPKIDLPTYGANQAAVLRFWVAAQDPDWPSEHYSVMISTTNTNIASFTSVFSETIQSGDWVQKSVPLTNYSNQNIYIAFRHHDVTDMFMMKLDDVMIELTQASDITPVLATKLNRNYPNPFNPTTRIEYSVKETAPVSLEIFNVKGQKVRTLVNEVMTAGNHSVVWNGKDEAGKDAGSGVYFYRMTTPRYTATQKMILMK